VQFFADLRGAFCTNLRGVSKKVAEIDFL
jgi:hypothetical protein